MSIPYVCSTCRLAVSAQSGRLRSTALRALSQSTFGRAEERTQRRDVPSGSGRYSRRELRPEQLLNQLQQPAERGQRSIRRPVSSAVVTEARPLPPETQVLVDELLRCSKGPDLLATWNALQRLDQVYRNKVPRMRGAWLNITNVSRTFAVLLHRATEQWLQSLHTPNPAPPGPTPYQMMLLLHNAYVTKALYYRPLIWQIARGLLHLRAKGAEQHEQGLRRGIDELMGIWRLCIGGHLTRKSFGDVFTEGKLQAIASVAYATDDWTFLPSATVFSSWQDRASDTAFENMLYVLLPEARPSWNAAKNHDPSRSDFASAALVTLDLLRGTEHKSTDGTTVSLATRAPYAALAKLLKAILQMAGPPRVPSLLERALISKEDVEISDHIKDMLERVGCSTASLSAALENREARDTAVTQEPAHVLDSELSTPASSHDPSTGGAVALDNGHTAVPARSKAEQFAYRQMDRLVRAMQNQNVANIPRIVNEVYRYSEEHKDSEPLPLDLYEHMLLASLSLRDTKTAVEIWHHMLRLGIKPTTKTYTAMMRGAQNARDVQGMEAFFHRMRQAGLQPDEYTWSIRIFALLKLRNVKVGMQALSEMGREWFAAAKAKAASDPVLQKQLAGSKNLLTELLSKFPGPVDGVPRPNLEIMNAAMAALAAVRPEEVPKVFTWGRSFGIEPDLATFNTLISISMQGKRADDALAVLRQMQQRGIQADTTTWTVLLTSLFEEGFLDNLSKDAQEAKIIGFIDALADKDSGLPGINSMGYAMIIDRLLKHYGNDTAAAAVFAHMTSNGHKPTAHIYTILMTYYFARQPQPDFSAIENLWRQVKDQGQGFMANIDVVFFDRMIEGYARNHHLLGVGPMEEFMRACRASGKKPGWKARESVARVYADRQMWSKLRTLVDESRLVMRDQVGRISKTGLTEFWDFIHSTGILQDEGYVNRDDFRKDRPVGSPLLRAEQEYARRRGGVLS
ncbi:hypothetical protein CB0940_02634 [Cercospora beticola]|uniref:Pentatricopeptide repeat-containing protein n=1 Tax=Cercospora beticola TaxID=122368 RepID=A0A2G5I1L6_CERBT|nr:hypothetical protein CB0940_02634 [Cercospora beticola]PIA98686.1 hypothetical protein CB0940_02634 [Cercospora beticola]WPA99780.1 hypothetical protein RHO25_004399 [Cercospora beticola]